MSPCRDSFHLGFFMTLGMYEYEAMIFIQMMRSYRRVADLSGGNTISDGRGRGGLDRQNSSDETQQRKLSLHVESADTPDLEPPTLVQCVSVAADDRCHQCHGTTRDRRLNVPSVVWSI
ncbi:hypothetical protein EVAR_31459_1 [Eumeta japonica]|uniref:Uncharacterized protein n=1 Tax=Eumeta variegata TaxID=151549 RepID=A0A4C1WBS6_EUMVA|nr:hypothetical protein EVAR_31459_1 [Eumeta japonica]